MSDYMSRFRLQDRLAVVTGGGRGIGLACVEALAQAGARVVILDRDGECARAATGTLLAAGVEAHWHEVDVTDPDAMTKVASGIEQQHGAVDILVCNAGIAISGVRAEDVTDEQWRRVIDINLNGVFWSCRAFGRAMLERGRGAIVNIGSMSGFIVNKPQEQASYNASKAAVHHLTRSLATEWATRGVRVNAVAPTYIDTPLTQFGMTNEAMKRIWLDMTPMGRVGTTEEVASVVLFLASDASSLLTGSIVLADGGYTSW